MSWDDFVEERILRPLGMERTTSRYAVVEARENVSGSHTGSAPNLVVMDRRDYDALGPAGSIYSSAWELAQWVRLHLRSEEHTSELQSRGHLVCGLLLEKNKKTREQR